MLDGSCIPELFPTTAGFVSPVAPAAACRSTESAALASYGAPVVSRRSEAPGLVEVGLTGWPVVAAGAPSPAV